MKKSLKVFASVMVFAILTSCGTAIQPEQVTVNPSPLTVVGNLVEADITGTFPVKKFGAKAVLTITPVLKYEGGEVVGEPVTFVGEKAKENGTTIPYKAGGRFAMKASFEYVPAMAKSELYFRFTAKNGNKVVEIPEMKLADGVVSTAKLVQAQDVKPQVTADKFQRIIQEVQEADIKFLICASRSSGSVYMLNTRNTNSLSWILLASIAAWKPAQSSAVTLDSIVASTLAFFNCFCKYFCDLV